ncbi:MAG TPA: lysylphosphatidylglycerol synthase transmembrane domain-containing protein, partial [Gemmatimonadales bacterium]|nr:lysylphosphatidylglycerol synthase transmembrane domain-containing protein [Gemmatimonadales bacterium]
MKRRTLLLCFLVGAAVLAYLIHRVGFGALVAEARHTGPMFPVIFASYGLVYVCNTAAWRVILGNGENRPTLSFWRAYALFTSGFALNFLTPMLNFGGEPFRVGAAGRVVGIRRAAASVLIHNVLRTLSFMFGWVTALAIALVLLPASAGLDSLLAGAMLVSGALIVVILAGHRRDLLTRTLNLLQRVPLLRRLGHLLEDRRPALIEIDRQVSDFYHRTPRRFWQALGLEYVSRWVLALEYYLILVSLGQHVSFIVAFVITILGGLITNLLFFFPYEVGSKEGGLFLLFRLFGIPGKLGVYAGLVDRVRDLAWIALGLVLVWFARSETVPAPTGVEEQQA